jgi:lipopolysaccharide/colanic/teichoic acid biosynthesis glycosyltransferase
VGSAPREIMKKRIAFHLLQFLILALLLFTSVYIYYTISYGIKFLVDCIGISYQFVLDRFENFILIAVITYFLTYAAGLIKYTVEDRHFRFSTFLMEAFKFLLVLGMVSFIEFFIFYDARIGRLIYVCFFFLYSFYYITYLAIRTDSGPRGLIWRANEPVENVLNNYIKEKNAFRILSNEEAEHAGPAIQVVYQDGHIDEITSETLIKDKLAGHSVLELAELVEKESNKIPLDYVNIYWFLEKFEVVDRNYFRSSRLFNIFMSLFLLLLLFLPGLIFALLHKCFSKGPIFFVQQRTGLHGKNFNLIKFRSMVHEAEKEGARFSNRNDPRITAIGKFMRRLRIDEIPQLMNVLKGNMSLVGPRPEREVFIESLTKEIPYYKLRLLVHPGLTGWAQVNGVYAGENLKDHKEKLELDLYYIKNRSIFMDLMILLRTIKTIIQAKGE